jgi:gliding motility-associated-like protein
MNRKLNFSLLMAFIPFLLKAQLVSTPNNNALQLANQLGGQGLNVLSATLDCPTDAAGTFSNGLNSDIGLGSGIILTTGSIQDLSSSGTDASVLLSNENGGPALPDLTPITTDPTFDGCKLTIQVKPICNTLSIKYVFASEEYSDYVNSTYNDVFAFFVSGPNPLGGNYTDQNIAVLPGTNTPITINTINNGEAPDGTVPTGPPTNAQFFNDNTNGTTNPYDGMTVPMLANINVVPCEIYTIKFAIADVGDDSFDSGVLLEANAVSCPINLVATATPHKICAGQTASLTGNVVGGTGSYSWSTGATGPSINVSPTVSTVYTCYYDFCGVTVSDTVSVEINPIAGATFQYTSSAFCKGGSNPLPINVANGNLFSSSPAGLVFINTTTGEIDIANSDSGTYVISLDGSGACPLPAQQTITIQNAPSAIISGTNSICSGDSATLSIAFNGTAPYTYTLNGPSGNQTFTTFQNPHLVKVGEIGNYSISALSDAACNGSTSGNVVISSKPKPNVTFSGGSNFCLGSNPTPIILIFTGTPPFVLNYTENGNPVSQTITTNTYTYTPTGAVNLQFNLLNDANSCAQTLNQNYNIVQSPSPVLSLTPNDSICFGNTKQLIASGATNYTWSPSSTLNNTINDTVLAKPNINTIYTVIGTNAAGCSDTAKVSIYIDNSVNAAFVYTPDSPTTLDTVKFINNSTTLPLSHQWNFGDNSPLSIVANASHLYTQEGEYIVILTVTNTRGCSDTVSRKIVVKDQYVLEIPNVFTPDNNGNNDVFKFIKAVGIKDLHCDIFNRWGKKVYQFDGPAGVWNGENMDGGSCSQGVYYYIVTLTNNSNEEKEFSGNVTLMR